MSTYIRDTAIVLRVRPHRERDAWVSFWTRHHGKQEAYATGLQTSTSKQRAHLQPFAEVELMLAEGKQFLRVAVAQMTAHHGSAARVHPVWSGILGAICRLCEALSGPQDPLEDERIFLLFRFVRERAAAFTLPFSPERALFVQAFLLQRFAGLFGYRVPVQQCTNCGASPISCTAFQRQEGGFLCATCERSHFAGRSSVFQTDEATLRKCLLFLEHASLDEALALSASKAVLRDLTLLLEGLLTVLPLKTSPHTSAYLLSVLPK